MSWWENRKDVEGGELPIRLLVSEYLSDKLMALRDDLDEDHVRQWMLETTEGNVVDLTQAQLDQFENVYRATVQLFIEDVR